MASQVPVIQRDAEGKKPLEIIESLLDSACSVTQCSAAALCILDESTSTLETRVTWGIAAESMDTSRPIERSIADIEAMVGHAVVIENTDELPHWRVPGEASSAICVPVSSMNTLLGTLWLFGDEIRDYDSGVVNMVEIIAGRLASELQFDAALEEIRSLRKASSASESFTLERRKPVVLPPVDEVKIEAIDGSGANPCVSDWSINEEGKLWLLSATVSRESNWADEIAASIQTSFCSLRHHMESPKKMVEGIADAISRLEPESSACQIQCVLIDLDNQTMLESSAGKDGAWCHLDELVGTSNSEYEFETGQVFDVATEKSGFRLTWQ